MAYYTDNEVVLATKPGDTSGGLEIYITYYPNTNVSAYLFDMERNVPLIVTTDYSMSDRTITLTKSFLDNKFPNATKNIKVSYVRRMPTRKEYRRYYGAEDIRTIDPSVDLKYKEMDFYFVTNSNKLYLRHLDNWIDIFNNIVE